MKFSDPLKLTQKLLRFNTINPPGQERECAYFLAALLEKEGFLIQFHEFDEKRTSFIASFKGSRDKKPIGFTGHIDVVPLGGAKWQKDPFSGELDGSKIYGRGSTDMKSGVASMVLAAIEVSKQKNLKAGIELIITAGEETFCEGAEGLARENILSPVGALVVGEPTGNYPFIGHKGICLIELIAQGKTAHSSLPHEGENAIFKACKALLKLENYDFGIKEDPLYGFPSLNVGTIQGGLNFNSVPDLAKASIDIRSIPKQKGEGIFNQIKELLGSEVRLNKLHISDGVNTDFNDPFVEKVCKVMEEYVEGPIEPKSAPYFTDASPLNEVLLKPPIVILGPGEVELAHKTDEYCFSEKIFQAQEAYIKIANQYCL